MIIDSLDHTKVYQKTINDQKICNQIEDTDFKNRKYVSIKKITFN